MTKRLLQLIDTSSILETLKIKIEKELKANVNKISVSSKKKNKIKDTDKYTDNYIKSRSFGIINFEGKEDGSKQK